jgi:hypothetical protein
VTSYCSDECRVIHESDRARLDELERIVSDHAQRFDTLQTNYLRRLWWAVRWGWPLTDLNAERPNWRPWNRG